MADRPALSPREAADLLDAVSVIGAYFEMLTEGVDNPPTYEWVGPPIEVKVRWSLDELRAIAAGEGHDDG